MLLIHAAVPALVALNRHVSVSPSSSVPCYMISPQIFTRKIHKNTDVANSCSCSSALCIKSKYQCIAMQSGIFLFLLKFAVFTLFRNKYSFSQGKCAKMLTFLIHAAVVELVVLNQNLIIHYITENIFFNKKMSTFC